MIGRDFCQGYPRIEATLRCAASNGRHGWIERISDARIHEAGSFPARFAVANSRAIIGGKVRARVERYEVEHCSVTSIVIGMASLTRTLAPRSLGPKLLGAVWFTRSNVAGGLAAASRAHSVISACSWEQENEA